MFALPPILVILILVYLKPQEYVPALAGLPLLYLAFALTILGFAVDVRLGLSRLRASPQLPFVILFVLWSLFTVAINAPEKLIHMSVVIVIPVVLNLLVGHTLQTFRALHAVGTLVLVIGLFLGAIGVHQGLASFGCHRMIVSEGQAAGGYDGRDCDDVGDAASCYSELAEPGAQYTCERVGLLGTSSIQGRVRYRGSLKDPNDLSLVIGIALPFAFALAGWRWTLATRAVLFVDFALSGACAIMTQSRGGQVVFLAVLATYFVRRLGLRGLLLGGILMLPLLLVGGRSGESAQESTIGRLESGLAGLEMLWRAPLSGVGAGQFTEHHFMTAHNSYILTSAELGLPGFFIWSSILYLSTKIPVQVLRLPGIAPIARNLALALLAALAGLFVGILFLSWTYKEYLWIYLAMTAALYHAVQRHDPDFRVRYSWFEAGLVLAADFAICVGLTVYTKLKLG